MEDLKQPIIVFAAGYEKYVYDAFDVQYLLKPVDEQKFAEVFKRAVNQAVSWQARQKSIIFLQMKICCGLVGMV